MAEEQLNNSQQSLRTVAKGLNLVYLGLCLIVFGSVWPYLSLFLTQLGFPFNGFVVIGGGALIVAGALLLTVIGNLLCLAVPAEHGIARRFIYISAPLTVFALALTTLDLLQLFDVFILTALVETLAAIETPLNLASFGFFALFLRQLAQDMRRPDLVRRETAALILTVLNVIFPEALRRFSSPGLGVAFLMLGLMLVWLVVYGNLLRAVRDALRGVPVRTERSERQQKRKRRR